MRNRASTSSTRASDNLGRFGRIRYSRGLYIRAICVALSGCPNGNAALLDDLAEHLHGVKPDINRLKLQGLVDLGNNDTLDGDDATVGLDTNLFALPARRQSY